MIQQQQQLVDKIPPKSIQMVGSAIAVLIIQVQTPIRVTVCLKNAKTIRYC